MSRMVAPRALWVVLALLSPACFSPSGSETSGTSSEPGTTTTGTTTGTTSSTTAGTTSTTTLEPTTSPITGTTTDPGPTSTDSGPTTTDATTTEPATASSTEPETSTTSTTTTASTTMPPEPVCGDGVVDGFEQCDDGNMVETDDCASCLHAFCGDGIVHAGVEECDEDGDNCEVCVRVYMRMFVSSVPMSADLDGLAEADERCQQLADGADLNGRFVAWLSTDLQHAVDRLEHSQRPYKRVDGVPLADDWTDLVTQMALDNPLDINEKGGKVGAGSGCGFCPVWTATTPQGIGLADDCFDWNSALVTDGAVGECTVKDARWTQGCAPKQCNQMARIYCVEQTP